MFYQKINNSLLYLLVFLLPLFFLPLTLEPLEINKQSLLVIVILLAGLAAIGNILSQGSLILKTKLLNLSLILFLIFLGLSTFFSGGGFLSWVGSDQQEYVSFVSLIALVAFLWLIESRTKNHIFLSRVILFCLGGSIVAGLIGLLSLFKIFLPFSFAQTQAFNTVGTINSLGIFLAITTILGNSIYLVWRGKNKILPTFIFINSFITFLFLIIIDYWVLWVVFLFGLLLILILTFWRAHELHHTKRYFLTMLLAAGSLLFLFAPFPQIIPIPAEITPNTKTSIEIVKQIMVGKNLWLGSGPGTYIFDYAKFRPNEVNQSNFWNLRFDRGSSFFLTILPTWGLLPLLSLGFFVLIGGFLAWKKIIKKEEEQWEAFIFLPPWLAIILAFLLYPSNLTLNFLFFLLSGFIISLVYKKEKKLSFTKSPRLKIAAAVSFIILSLVIVTTLFLTIRRFDAEAAFSKAVKLDRNNGDLKEIITLIDKAATTNNFDASYYRNLATALLLQANQEITSIGTAQPTEEQNNYLQALIAASINSAKKATEIEPRDVTNWLELASVYRTFTSLVPDTDVFAIKAGQTAINLEPNNPTNHLEFGKTYLTLAAALEPLTVSNDPTKKQTAEQKRKEYFTAAENELNTAISLKPDFAPAHYQLALVFEQQGRLNEAVGKMESINKYNSQDVGVAFELGLLYLRRLGEGDLSRAENAFKQAITLLPSYSNAHWYLAFVYEQQGNLPAAIYEVEAVQKLNPDNEMVKARLERLKTGQTTKTNETVPLEESTP